MEERQCLVFNRMGRASLAEKEIVEQRPEKVRERGEEVGKSFQVSENSECKGPVARMCLAQKQQGGSCV